MSEEEIRTLINATSKLYLDYLIISDDQINTINNYIFNNIIKKEDINDTLVIDKTKEYYVNYVQSLFEKRNYNIILDYLKVHDSHSDNIFLCLKKFLKEFKISYTFDLGYFLIQNYPPISEYFKKASAKTISYNDQVKSDLYDIYCDENGIEVQIEEDTKIDNFNTDSFKMYMNDIKDLTVLTREEELDLFTRYKETNDPNIRGEIIKRNLKLVVNIAKKFKTDSFTGVDFLDLIQAGNIGLMEAVERFDYTKGFKFSTYATWWIKQQIYKQLNNQGNIIRVPANTKDIIIKINKAREDFVNLNNREPSAQELSSILDLPVKVIEEHDYYSRNLSNVTSLDMPVGEEQDGTLLDFFKSNDPSVEEQAEGVMIRDNIKRIIYEVLSPFEAEFISKRFGFETGIPQTLEYLSKHYNISYERARNVERIALKKLRGPVGRSKLLKGATTHPSSMAQSEEPINRRTTITHTTVDEIIKDYSDEDKDFLKKVIK